MKVAILFRGGISKTTGNFALEGAIDDKSEFVNFKSAFNSFKKHILDTNPQHDIDIFIHTWHPELEEELQNLYKPKKILVEENDLYTDEISEKVNFCQTSEIAFGVVSQSLSMKKVSNLVKEYSEENKIKYDLIFIYRLDVLLVVDLLFEDYNPFYITCNNWEDCLGEFHFAMSYQNMLEFCKVYDYFSPILKPICHFYYKDYVRNYLGRKYVQDNIRAGVFQECVRKATSLVSHGFIKPEDLIQYGVTYEELLTYKH
jgi:hypothetical protein